MAEVTPPVEAQRLSVGDRAPAFTLPDANENPVSLSDYAGQKVIVYFYPAASTPGCTKQACDFRDKSRPTSRPSWPSSSRRKGSPSPC